MEKWKHIKSGKSNRQIANIFGVHPRTISDIKNLKTWEHI